MLHCNRQGRKAEDLRSRGNTRTQRAHNTGTNNRPAPNASNIIHMLISFNSGFWSCPAIFCTGLQQRISLLAGVFLLRNVSSVYFVTHVQNSSMQCALGQHLTSVMPVKLRLKGINTHTKRKDFASRSQIPRETLGGVQSPGSGWRNRSTSQNPSSDEPVPAPGMGQLPQHMRQQQHFSHRGYRCSGMGLLHHLVCSGAGAVSRHETLCRDGWETLTDVWLAWRLNICGEFDIAWEFNIQLDPARDGFQLPTYHEHSRCRSTSVATGTDRRCCDMDFSNAVHAAGVPKGDPAPSEARRHTPRLGMQRQHAANSAVLLTDTA